MSNTVSLVVGGPLKFWQGLPLLVSELLLAVAIGIGLLGLGADGTAWILGGIAAGAIAFAVYHTRYNPAATPNRNARKVGQMLVGLMVGFSIQHSNVSALAAQLPSFLLLTVCLLVGGVAIGGLYARVAKVDLLTALLATTPGNIGVMASVAAEYGKNPALVSFIQLLRFTAVTSLIPVLTQTTHHQTLAAVLPTLAQSFTTVTLPDLLCLVLVLGLAGFSIHVGERLRIPVPGLMCPLLVGGGFDSGFNWLPLLPSVDFQPPLVLNIMGQILLGITIGEYWGKNPTLSKRAIAHGLVPVVLTIVVGLATAGIALLVTSWDWLTCLLVTAPGGSPEMIWIALALDRNVEIVTAGHLVRLIALNLLLPLLIMLAERLDLAIAQRQRSHLIQTVIVPTNQPTVTD